MYWRRRCSGFDLEYLQQMLRKIIMTGSALGLISGALSIGLTSDQAHAKNAQANILAANAKPAPTKKLKGGTDEKKSPFGNAGGSGTLVATAKDGKEMGACALKHTDVNAEISGYVARVTVKQTFTNPFKNKIEAVYKFPLSENGAVDDMLMKVGSRTIHGTIKKREEARQIYEDAMAQGYVASLLEQERSNIFTQSVANIEPGKDIEVTLTYIETLPFEKGQYSFAFPTVVGPRFIPGNAVSGGAQGGGFSPNTDRVPDASAITPVPAKEGERAGHDISINVKLNAGMPIQSLSSALHEVEQKTLGEGKSEISLVDKNTIPNKDFVLTWNVAQDSIKSGYLTYKQKNEKDGYFTLMLVPPKKVTPETVAPKEMIFVIDCSGSQSGAPLNKAKETMLYILDHMNANDSFQVITFNNDVTVFPQKPEVSSESLRKRAKDFISKLEANGGTWMAPAVEKACKTPADEHRLRIVTFMTDGYVGNDMEILGLVKKMRDKSRWFPFGTGNSVNRALIDGMAKEGGGEAEYVLLNSSAEEVGKKFYDRIANPVLTDIKLTFDNLDVKEVFPKEVSDVWAERPLYFKGRYTAARAGTVTLTGYAGGKPYIEKLQVNFPEENTANAGIASLWARAKVDRLMSEDWFGAQQGTVNKEIKEEIIATALKHHIMTQYTSFVAVDDSVKTKGDKADKVDVPVEMPDGVSREGVFGKNKEMSKQEQARRQQPGRGRAVIANSNMPAMYGYGAGSGAGMTLGAPMASRAGGGGGGAAGGGYFMSAPVASPSPSPVPMAKSAYAGGYKKRLAVGNFMPPPPATIQMHHALSAGSGSAAGIAKGALQQATSSSAVRGQVLKDREKELSVDKSQTKPMPEMKATDADDSKTANEKLQTWQHKLSPALSKLITATKEKSLKLVIKLNAKATPDMLKKLKVLGVEITQAVDLTKDGGLTLTAKVPTAKVKDLAKLDFVLKLLLESDRS